MTTRKHSLLQNDLGLLPASMISEQLVKAITRNLDDADDAGGEFEKHYRGAAFGLTELATQLGVIIPNHVFDRVMGFTDSETKITDDDMTEFAAWIESHNFTAQEAARLEETNAHDDAMVWK